MHLNQIRYLNISSKRRRFYHYKFEERHQEIKTIK